MRSRVLFQAGLLAALSVGARVIAAQQQAPSPIQQQVPNPQEQRPRDVPGTRAKGKSAAVFDLTGYWVAVINEDWRWRMLTPPKDDYSGVPITLEGRRVTDLWDPAADEAAGVQCKSYGAAAIMRVPTRLHITWQDDNTLKIETDAGMQTRLIHFGAQESAAKLEPSWQGHSIGAWEGEPGAAGGRRGGPGGPRDLKVLTSGLRAGYLRKNGVPYSGNATVTEYVDLFSKQPNGDEWMVDNVIVHDPIYLTEPFITSDNFKREPDGSKWRPTPCTAR